MKSRKATIKKPKFLVSYFISVIVLLAVFTTAGVIYFMPEYYVYNFGVMESASGREEAIYYYIKDGIANPELTATDLVEARRRLIDHYCETGERYAVIVDGKYKLDTSRTAILDHTYIAEDGEESRVYLQLADRDYLKYFDTPEVLGESFIDKGYSGYFIHDSRIAFVCASRMSSSTRKRRASIRSTLPSTAGTGFPYAIEAIAPAVYGPIPGRRISSS